MDEQRASLSDLPAWIAVLRARLACGELAALAPIDLGDGTAGLPAALIVRIMLAALDSLEELAPDQARDPVNAARHVGLLVDFRALRFLIG